MSYQYQEFDETESESNKKRPRTPQEKKAISYEKDRVISGEYPHAIRKHLPLKKARASRSYRRQIHMTLTEAEMRLVGEHLEDVGLDMEQRKKLPGWHKYNARLKDMINWRSARRARHMLFSFFENPYNSQVHRERFVVFLTPQLTSKKPFAHQLAVHINDLLEVPIVKIAPIDHHWNVIARKEFQTWLRNFFQDEPNWEPRLQEWIGSWGDRH